MLYINNNSIKVSSPQMQDQAEKVGALEHKRTEFIRLMEVTTPREVLEAIEHVNAHTPGAPSEWPEFITQTHGACYAS